MDITNYIEKLSKEKIISTGDVDVKNAIIKHLETNDIKHICTMDDCFQYTIQLL